MAAKREYTVLELDGARLCALSAVVTAGNVEVTRWHTAECPAGTQADNAATVGSWIGEELRTAGLDTARTVLAVGRNDVVLKPISLPAAEGLGEASIAGAVRLQMVRQLTMAVDGAAIDYAVMPTKSDGSMVVLAGAMPGERVKWLKNMAEAADCRLARIALRCSGAAAQLGEVSQRRAGPVLGVVVGRTTTEFVVVEDGQMVLARATDLTLPESTDDLAAFAQRLAIEAKRTWVSHPPTSGGAELEFVGVLGKGDVASLVAAACGEVLGVTGQVVGLPPVVKCHCDVPEADRGTMSALVGLLTEQVQGRPMLDFANPRKAPDVAAKMRQAVLVGTLLLILVGGVSIVMAQKRLGALRSERDVALAEEASQRKQLEQYLIVHARINHMEQWRNARVDWLPHIRRLSDELPDPHDSTTDELTGRMASNSFYDPRGKSTYPGGEWKTGMRSTFSLSGKVDNRTVAAELRERLLTDGVYQVGSRGPDMPDRYSMELVTSLPSPAAKPLAKPAGQPAGEPTPAPKDAGQKGAP